MFKLLKKIVFISSLTLPLITLSATETLIFGVVPQQSASKLARSWVPILQYINAKADVNIVFATAPSIPEFERRTANGEYDIAYMNPYHYTVFNRSPGYQAFAKQKNKKIKGIFVTRKDSSITELRQLSGTTLSFPAPAAFAASILTRAKLSNEKIPFSAKYVRSHDSVYRSVAKGLYPAGGGIERTFNNVDKTVKDQLRILWTSQGYTPHALAAHPRVPVSLVNRIKDVMIGMNDDEKGKKLLKSINFKGVKSAKNSDWDDIRGLGIDLLKRLIKE